MPAKSGVDDVEHAIAHQPEHPHRFAGCTFGDTMVNRSATAHPATRSPGGSRHPPLLAVVAATLLFGAACSSSDDATPATTTSTLSAQQWASGVCSTLDTWITTVSSTLTSTDGEGSLSQRLTAKIDGVNDATEAAVSSLKAEGAPKTTDGEKVRAEVDGLAARLHDNAGVVRTFSTAQVNSVGDLLSRTQNITVAVKNSVIDVQQTFDRIQKLDPSGELQQGFASAPDCQNYRAGASAFGSSSAGPDGSVAPGTTTVGDS